VPILSVLLADKDENPLLRTAVAEALGRYAAKAASAAGPLAQVVGDVKAELGLRRTALLSLGKVSDDVRVVWPTARAALKDTDSTLRSHAVRVAGPLGKAEKEIVAALETTARKDGNVEVRIAAIQELGQLGAAAKSAEPTLSDLAQNDPRPTVRQAAQAALKLLKGAP
jgi:HEAT repeat protein